MPPHNIMTSTQNGLGTSLRSPAFTLFAGQPQGLPLLFFTELWERFSYYGMRALLVLYLTKYLHFSDANAYALYGTYTALVYIGPVIGGFLADRILGPRRAAGFGGILIALGHFTLAVTNMGLGAWAIGEPGGMIYFYLALALIITGEAFFKVNISTLVGRLYEPGDKRRDAGFTLFYMGINLGALAATVLCGWLGESVGWDLGFGLAGIGMLIGLAVFFRGIRRLGPIGEAPDPARLNRPLIGSLRTETAIYLGGIVVLALALVLVQMPDVVGALLAISGVAGAIGLLAYALLAQPPEGRDRLLVVLVLAIFTVVFWALFEQAGASLTLFADRHVDRHMFGIAVDASQLQFLNPLFILLLAPFFSRFWLRLERNGQAVTTPAKFALGLALLGGGFAVLVVGSAYFGKTGVPLVWLVLLYLLHTAGELCLSPIGLSMVTKLSPPRSVGVVMGFWFFATAAGQYLAGQFSRFAAPASGGGADPIQSLHGFVNLFGILALIAFFAALLLFGASKPLADRMHGAD
jgi:POT family proton-dependent oligopeptide transporter